MTDTTALIEAALSLFVIVTFLCLYQLFKRLPGTIYRYVAKRASFRHEKVAETIETQIGKAREKLSDTTDILALTEDIVQRIIPALSKQERHLQTALGRAMRDQFTDDIITDLNHALVETEEVIGSYRDLGKKIQKLTESELRSTLLANKSSFEASQQNYRAIIQSVRVADRHDKPQASA